MGEEATPPGVVVMTAVEDVEFDVNPIPHVVEVGSISTENVDDDVFEVVDPRVGVFHCGCASVTKASKLLVLTQ
jgi:hypothetical protein